VTHTPPRLANTRRGCRSDRPGTLGRARRSAGAGPPGPPTATAPTRRSPQDRPTVGDHDRQSVRPCTDRALDLRDAAQSEPPKSDRGKAPRNRRA